MVNVKPITLEIDQNLWDKFKDKVPRSITLNNAIVTLIEKYLKRR